MQTTRPATGLRSQWISFTDHPKSSGYSSFSIFGATNVSLFCCESHPIGLLVVFVALFERIQQQKGAEMRWWRWITLVRSEPENPSTRRQIGLMREETIKEKSFEFKKKLNGRKVRRRKEQEDVTLGEEWCRRTPGEDYSVRLELVMRWERTTGNFKNKRNRRVLDSDVLLVMEAIIVLLQSRHEESAMIS